VFTDALLNSELFGHEKGAFTGAIRQKKGRFELAQGGTLFLDEIGDLQPSTQLRLLRVLQDRRIERVGGEKTIELDVRIIAATHRDLRRRIAEGLFREDLFYRLSVLPVHVPPLRERLEDLPVLAAGILKRKKHSIASAAEHFAPETLRCLAACSWPGNVRELENVVEFAMVFAKGPTIEPEHLPTHLRGNFAARPSNSRPTLEQVERRYIAEVLQECGQNKKLAAQILGIQRSTLYSKLRRYGLEP
jgi:two-component system response regulator HydG